MSFFSRLYAEADIVRELCKVSVAVVVVAYHINDVTFEVNNLLVTHR